MSSMTISSDQIIDTLKAQQDRIAELEAQLKESRNETWHALCRADAAERELEVATRNIDRMSDEYAHVTNEKLFEGEDHHITTVRTGVTNVDVFTHGKTIQVYSADLKRGVEVRVDPLTMAVESYRIG